MSRIVVDYEELHRLARVWLAASEALGGQAARLGEFAADPAFAIAGVFEPVGVAALGLHLFAIAAGPGGLVEGAARLAADSARLEAAVAKERLVDDFPARELAAVGAWLTLAPVSLAVHPGEAFREGRRRLGSLADASVGYLAPYTELLLMGLAPSSRFRADVALRRPDVVEPVFGLPLAAVGAALPEGPGSISTSRYRPLWESEPAPDLGSLVARIGDLEAQPEASMAVQEVVGADGVRRFVVELPGMRHFGVAGDPLDLSGAVSAVALPATAYTRCVTEALDAAGVPVGAQVALVGHSQGGIVAMDLAADPAFNGGRVHVTHVLTAGSPISSKRVLAPTKVLSVENVNDVVTHLDAVRSPVPVSPAQVDPRFVTYQFADDRHHAVATHRTDLYAQHLDALDGSPNPLLRGFLDGLDTYRSGKATTTVFVLHDRGP